MLLTRFVMSSNRQIRVFPSAAELALSLSQLLVNESKGVDKFRIGLSGGSLVQLLSRELPNTAGLNTEGWQVAMCDERLVPFSDPESTYGEYKRQLLPLGLLSESQFVVIDPSLSVEDAATDYEKKLREIFPGDDLPNFDLLILGIGPDGHTASLFPGHPILEVTDKIVAPISDSPKPPPERVTLTLPVINAAKTVVFVATGEGKATVLKRILQEESDPLPAARVSPVNGKLLWFLDESAARDLTCPVEKHSVL
ncbi:6-phosphogluconolactonase isoform X3 [Hyla sarda]|uniref:6-phosphogluconolactonase isoform X3 n=1 Tax=Hyla sarda TaxID=327740 RepID=UPI0024C2615D|nr:6-phosphogluconolactonase isoform X3 [Hyla sarda]